MSREKEPESVTTTYVFPDENKLDQANQLIMHKMASGSMDDSCMVKFFRAVPIFWRGMFSIVWPIICLAVFALGTETKFRCMYLTLVMGGFWVTEAIPLPITSMLPIVYFPLAGILDTEATCMSYFKETIVMFLGGIMIAIAIEHSKLHYRIAMTAILCIGCSPRKLHFGLMFMTMFISMWISNTAACAMMCPIIAAVLEEFEAQGIGKMYIKSENVEKSEHEEEKQPSDQTKAYFLAAAYAASIGGLGTIVGSGTNLTFRGIYETRFPNSDGINFTSWMLYNIPTVLIMTLLSWVWLQILYLGLFRPKSEAGKQVQKGVENEHIAREVIKKKYNELGKMSWHEIWVAIFFILIVLLWFFRKPGFVKGWPDYVTDLKVKDATPALLVVFLMFLVPSEPRFFRSFRDNPLERPTTPSPSLLTWKVLSTKTPWGLMFLLGGGFALAEGSKRSGMSEYLGNSLTSLKVLHPFLILVIVCVIASCLTELTSNVAIANILLPVLAEMSVAIKVHPMYLTLPAAICCSFAFMLPVGTPPNAIVAGLANIRSADMAKAGLGVSFITLLVIIITYPTYGRLIYGLSEFPEWAIGHN